MANQEQLLTTDMDELTQLRPIESGDQDQVTEPPTIIAGEVTVELVDVTPSIQPLPSQPSKKAPPKKKNNAESSGGAWASDDILRLYLVQIGEYPLLTKDDEVRLAKQREAGIAAKQRLDQASGPMSPAKHREERRLIAAGEEAEKTFLCSNLRLVVSIAKKYTSSGMPIMDLIQEGNFGLAHAVEKFDWQKGFKFSTYATWWIRQAIERGIANKNDIIRFPVHTSEDIARLNKAELKLKNLNIEPTAELVARELDWTEKIVNKVRINRSMSSLLSFDEPIGDYEGSATVGDMIGDPKSNEGYSKAEADIDLSIVLTEALGTLDERDRALITFMFGLDDGVKKSLRATGEVFGITTEGARKAKIRALAKLRESPYGLEDLMRGLDD